MIGLGDLWSWHGTKLVIALLILTSMIWYLGPRRVRESIRQLLSMPLNAILDDIQRALDNGAPYAALATVVTLPEICGRCELLDPLSTKGKNRSEMIYKRFTEQYLSSWSLNLAGEDLYNLRCGLSHRGRTTQRNNPIRYVFHPPNEQNNRSHGNRVIQGGETTFLDIDLQQFVDDISAAVRSWSKENENNETVQKNLNDVIQVRQGPFGIPVDMPELVHIA